MPANGPDGTGKAEADVRNDMAVRTATNKNRQAAADGQKNVRNRFGCARRALSH